MSVELKLRGKQVADSSIYYVSNFQRYIEQLRNWIKATGWDEESVLVGLRNEDGSLLFINGANRHAALRLLNGDFDIDRLEIPVLLFQVKDCKGFANTRGFGTLVREIYRECSERKILIDQRCVTECLARAMSYEIPPKTHLIEPGLFIDAYPNFKRHMDDYSYFCLKRGGRKCSHPWEVAMAVFFAPPVGQKVLECGGRNSFYASYVTRMAAESHVIDFFQGWKDFGEEEVWFRLWPKAAYVPGNLICSRQDMRGLEYEDNTFDQVVSISAVEHSPDDVKSLQELARVCKPGGQVVISTDFHIEDNLRNHARIYSLETFKSRLLEPSGLVMDKKFYLTVEKPHHVAAEYVPAMVFLHKP
jgi:SAM-dependent methyltransferase